MKPGLMTALWVFVTVVPVLSSCNSSKPQIPLMSEIAVTEEQKKLRRKYGVTEDAPKTQAELLNQIFADDDVDPHAPRSRELKRMAQSKASLRLYETSSAREHEDYSAEQQDRDKAIYNAAITTLLASPTFRLLYESRISQLLSMPQSKVVFNNQGINGVGAISGAFDSDTLGITLYLDLSVEINILTTSGIVKAAPERVIAHELLETLYAIGHPQHSSLSSADPGLMGMDVVLQVNQIIRELVGAGVFSRREGASRIRYYR
jgi:hypothetical protein